MNLQETESRTQVGSIDSDDGYIDLELSLSSSSSSLPSTFITFPVNFSPPHNREFEFQFCSSVVASGESTTYPADELFYKGRLLPLHLPPRLQMVQNLLASSIDTLISPRAAVSSPRKFSSSEIVVNGSDEQCILEISMENKRFIENNENLGNNWSKKIKHSSITQKLKASRIYIRSLFSKQGCSDSSEIHPQIELPKINNNAPLIHRRSFSGVIQRHCSYSSTKCSSSSSSSASSLSSSFSFGSNGSLDLQTLMRSSEIDNSIEGAIEHCKQSRMSNMGESELSSSRTSVSTCCELEQG